MNREILSKNEKNKEKVIRLFWGHSTTIWKTLNQTWSEVRENLYFRLIFYALIYILKIMYGIIIRKVVYFETGENAT